MGKLKKPSKQKTKGMPSAVGLAILIYIGLFFLAGAWIVITIIPPKEEPPVVRINQPSPIPLPPPPLPTNVDPQVTPEHHAPIISETDREDVMTAVNLPPGGGPGDSLMNLLPPNHPVPGEIPGTDTTRVWPPVSIGNDLKGVYYDFKRSRSGNYTGAGQDTYREAVRNFLKSDGWDITTLSRFYRAPENRYTVCMMLPTTSSSAAPVAFGEDPGSGTFWMVHFKGEIVYPEDITFRFWGVGDEFLVVRLDDKIVFADVWPSNWDDIMGSLWRSNDPESKRYLLGHDTTMNVGDWVTLKAGQPVDMEIAAGDNGGLAALMLLVEVKGVEYELNRQGGPILPVFKTAKLSHDLLDLIYKDLAPNEACLTNGPVFNDYGTK